jgi:2-methylcitrate dehydratase PrpD
VLEACLNLSSHADVLRHGLDKVESIQLTGHSLLRQRTDRPHIHTGRESQVSAQHAVAVSLTRGRAGLAEFSDEAVRDQSLKSLGSKVCFVDDDGYSVDSAKVVVKISGVEPIEVLIEVAQGAVGRPLSDRDIEDKVRALCLYGKSGVNPEPLIKAVWDLEQSTDVGQIMKLVVGSTLPFQQ